MDYTNHNHNTERWTNKYISLEDGFYIENDCYKKHQYLLLLLIYNGLEPLFKMK